MTFAMNARLALTCTFSPISAAIFLIIVINDYLSKEKRCLEALLKNSLKPLTGRKPIGMPKASLHTH
jgi:hypothetical protein